MNISIMAGGPKEYWPNLAEYQDKTDIWVGVDKGVVALLNEGIKPQHSFGDFDSIPEEELQLIQEKLPDLHVFPSEKDETDLEIALNWAIKQHPKNIFIFGATGGRADHYLANVQLLQNEEILPYVNDIGLFIVDRQNIMTVKCPSSFTVACEPTYKYLSLIAVTKEVKGITLEGFKYPLHKALLKRGSTLCISNELISEYGNVSFESGIIMMIRSSD